jgi:protein-S-isoprenylcysteine O-methyltransferase Ste14
MSTLSTPISPSTTRTSDVPARVAIFAYGLVAYATFVAAFAYAIGFLLNWLVPKGIDSGTPGPLIPSLLINTLLLSLFVIQHTIMARPWFKRAWTTIIPRAAERSTYVLLASAILLVTYWQWRPLPDAIWSVSGPAAWVLNGLSLFGFGIVFAASLMINHFDLFGLRQSWLRFRGKTYRPVGFRLVGLYKIIRHPLMLGFLIAFWATPVMTVGHLFFSIMTTGYIMLGVWFEERDLIAEHGENYLKYRRSTRAIIPLPKSA